MRRNSENLLLLAGHEGARKWSEPVPLTDVARAAISEIEQYNRVALKIQPGVMVPGPAVSDIAHLLAELIENATVFSASDTQVLVSVQELASGGVLIQVSDSGVGISEARLAEMNRTAGRSARDRRIGIPAHGAVRGGAPGRTSRGASPVARREPGRADRPGLVAGQLSPSG